MLHDLPSLSAVSAEAKSAIFKGQDPERALEAEGKEQEGPIGMLNWSFKSAKWTLES